MHLNILATAFQIEFLNKSSRLFLNSCQCHMRLKAASILDHYLGNAKKVVPQNMHFILDLFDYKVYYWSVLYGRL